MQPFAQAGYAYRLALLLTLSRRQAARCAVAALQAAGEPMADDPARGLALRVAEQVRPGRRWLGWARRPRGSDRWLPWRELQLDGGPPDAWEMALSVAKLPARLRLPLALCALTDLSPAQAAGALGLDPVRGEELVSAAMERTARAAGLAFAGAAWTRLGPSLRYVLDHEPVPPVVTAAVPGGGDAAAAPPPAVGTALPGLSAAMSGAGDYTGADEAVDAGRPARRRWGWRGWLAAALVVGALGLAGAPDAARWLGGPPPEPAADAAADGFLESRATNPPAPARPGVDVEEGYTVVREGNNWVVTGPPIVPCAGPDQPLPENVDIPWRLVRRLSNIADGEWAQVSRRKNLVTLTAGPAGWELVSSGRGWLYGMAVDDCHPVITVDVGGSVHQTAAFRYGDHLVSIIELHFESFAGEPPSSEPVQVGGWTGRLISTSAGYQGPPSVYFELPAEADTHHFVVFEGRAGSTALPVDELLAHLEDFVPAVLGRKSPS